ncbi:MAG: hypothetical protein N2114_00130 [Candidatus Goldbacteria bacterium]|nr:hypothetical protein [Candidatus Goldiibacteriota bacterium]
MTKKLKKGKEKNYEKKLDMAEHDYKLKMLGISNRITKFIIRTLLLLIPIIILLIWLVKTIK